MVALPIFIFSGRDRPYGRDQQFQSILNIKQYYNGAGLLHCMKFVIIAATAFASH